jgi:hypothetical protein
MGSFAAGSVVGGVAGAQGLALYGAKTSATFVFYSNAWYKATAATAAAAAWAQANGGRLIQNTRWDVGAKTAQMGWDKAKPIVDAASAQFAMHAKGIVDVFHMSQGVRVNATWAEIEYLHLMFNPYVTGIVYHTVY